MANSRRSILALCGVGLAMIAANRAIRWGTAPGMELEPLPDIPGFRRLPGGEVTRGVTDPLIGLDAAASVAPTPLDALCEDLFRKDVPRGVPVAYFTDYFCPRCRGLSAILLDRAAQAQIALTYHELPLISEGSEPAARMALAARNQGAYDVLHARLMRANFVPTEAYIRDLAESIGIDGNRLLADMASLETDAALRRSRALAARFRFFGTPALVVGRTAVLGQIETRRLDDLIALEAVEPPVCP